MSSPYPPRSVSIQERESDILPLVPVRCFEDLVVDVEGSPEVRVGCGLGAEEQGSGDAKGSWILSGKRYVVMLVIISGGRMLNDCVRIVRMVGYG